MEEMTSTLLKVFFPETLVEHFMMTKYEEIEGTLSFWFDEKDIPPYAKHPIESKGFVPAKELRDFPIRGKPCTLYIRRRRWKEEGQKGYLMREIKLVEEGTKLLVDFALFFEGGNRTGTEDAE